jgi:hypothetical protein
VDSHAGDPRYMINQRADWHLSNWAQWMQEARYSRGFDDRSAVVAGHGSPTFDDIAERVDRNCARVMDAIIDGLPSLQQMAIHNVYIADVWKPNRPDVNMVDVFVEAAAEAWRQAEKRGLL